MFERNSLNVRGIVAAMVLAAVVLLLIPGCGVPADAAATVNGVVIGKDAVDDRIRVARGITPQNVPADTESEEYRNLQRDVTEQLVSEELERLEAQKRGITVGSAEIEEIMQDIISEKYLSDESKMNEDFQKRGLTREDLQDEVMRRLVHQKIMDSLRQEIPIEEQEVRAQYDANKASYVSPEKRQVRQIVVADEAAAAAALSRVAAGEDFATVATQVSIDPRSKTNGGMLGLVTRDSLPQAVGDVAFSLNQNEVSTPFKSDQGWYVVKVEFVSPAVNRSFEEVKGELTGFLSNQRLSQRYKEYVEEVKESYDIEYADDYSPREREPGEQGPPQPSLS